MSFLAILKVKVIDVSANPSSRPPIQEQSHFEVMSTTIEKSAEVAARNMSDGAMVDYYEIQLQGPQLVATLHPVTLKTTPRAAGPETEFAVIRANGQDVGQALVQK